MYNLRRCFLFAALLSVTALYGQDASVKKLSLTDMSDFKSQAGNWQVVGDVAMDPAVDIHEHAEPPAAIPKKE